MKRLAVLFDTSAYSVNLGDFIIMDAVNTELPGMINDKQVVTLPSHAGVGARGRRKLRRSEFSIMGGTNILSSHVTKYRQWKFNWLDFLALGDTVLMGAGWWSYQDKPDGFSSWVWRKILSDRYLHSVRDEYTERMLKGIGVDNVINTGCPTMWRLTPDHCLDIPKGKGSSVVFTVSAYRKNKQADSEMLGMLRRHYSKIYFWPQGLGDIDYLASFDADSQDIEILAPNLPAYDSCLASSDDQVDYVGTRLHAGIRALQHKRRSVIIGVDNRAQEKSRSYDIVVVDRSNIPELEEMITSEFETKIRLPEKNIETYKGQFRN